MVWVSFLLQTFRLFNWPFLTEFYEYNSKGMLSWASFFVKLWGFRHWYFGRFGTINARYISHYERVSGDFVLEIVPIVGWNKLIRHNWLVTRSEIYPLYFIWRAEDDGWFSKKNRFILLHLIFYVITKFFYDIFYVSIRNLV